MCQILVTQTIHFAPRGGVLSFLPHTGDTARAEPRGWRRADHGQWSPVYGDGSTMGSVEPGGWGRADREAVGSRRARKLCRGGGHQRCLWHFPVRPAACDEQPRLDGPATCGGEMGSEDGLASNPVTKAVTRLHGVKLTSGLELSWP